MIFHPIIFNLAMIKLMRNYLPFFVLFVMSLQIACKPKTDAVKKEDNAMDRQVLLTHMADSIIIPAYGNFKSQFDAFYLAANTFSANPTESNLITLRTKWAEAYIQWQTVELFDFGPADKQTIRNFYNIYPADTTGIQFNIANPSANLEVPASYSQQGFPAFDYLLNGTGTNDAGIIAFYTHPTESAKRLEYINRLSNRMQSLLSLVMNDWNGVYRETFINKTGLDIGSSTSLMVNGLVLHYERFIRSGKFGIPSGAILNGVASPEKVEAFYKKDLSLSLAKTAHQAYFDCFNGKSFHAGIEGPSLKTYLNALGAKDGVTGQSLSEIINAQFVQCNNKINGLNQNLYQEIVSNNQAVKDVFTEMQAAVRMLKVDMTSAMSITITFTDNDGD